MKKQRQHHPPSWAQRFIEWYCKPGLVEDLTGDLHECFERNVESMGPRLAKLIYIVDALKFFRIYTVRRPAFINLFMNWIMIGSYIKTSTRNVIRNKMFSSINICWPGYQHVRWVAAYRVCARSAFVRQG